MRLYMLFVMPILTLASAGLFATPFDELNGLAHCAAIKDLNFSADMAERDFNSAYRKLALFFHPDKNREKPDWAKEKATEVNVERDKALKLLGTTPSQPAAPSKPEQPSFSMKKLEALLKTFKIQTPTDRVFFPYNKAFYLNNIPDISEQFFILLAHMIPDIKDLDIRKAKIKKLPESIGDFKSLQKLVWIDSKIEEFPENIFSNLPELRLLDLSENLLKKLPKDLNKLKNLKTLLLYKNNLEENEIAKITELKNLETLYLKDYHNLKQLPASIENLKKLDRLVLESNGLKELPNEIGKLSNLTDLHLTSSEIKKLPATIGYLEKLASLALITSKLETLPPEIGYLEKLTYLTLDTSKLETLPPEIGKLGELTSLRIVNSNLKTLPPEIGKLEKLKSLILSTNKLETLPPEMSKLANLEKLGLYGKINKIPEVIAHLPKLEEFSTDNKKLTVDPIIKGLEKKGLRIRLEK